jgi:ABC-2 type transport system permease protein
MSLMRAFAATVRAVLADRGLLLLFVFVVPIYSFYYPLAYQTQAVRQIPIEIVDLDGSGLSRRLAFDLAAAPDVRIVGQAETVAAASDRLAAGHSAGIIVIPAGFDRDLLRGSPTAITVFGAGAYPVQYKAVVSAVAPVVGALGARFGGRRLAREGAPALVLAQLAQAGPAMVERSLFNLTGGYGSYVVSAVGILIVHQVLLMACAALAGTWVEQRRGPIFDAPPRSLTGALAGSALGLALFVLAALLYMIGFAFWFQDFPRAANMAGALVFAPLMALTVAALGLALGAWFAVRERALQFMLATSVPFLFLTGTIFPREAIPSPVLAIGWLLPTTPGINGFVKLDQMGASLGEVAPECLHLLVLLLVYSGAALLMWQRRRE